jgi:hypothetical protein
MSPDFLDEILDAELVTPPIALVAWASTSKAHLTAWSTERGQL